MGFFYPCNFWDHITNRNRAITKIPQQELQPCGVPLYYICKSECPFWNFHISHALNFAIIIFLYKHTFPLYLGHGGVVYKTILFCCCCFFNVLHNSFLTLFFFFFKGESTDSLKLEADSSQTNRDAGTCVALPGNFFRVHIHRRSIPAPGFRAARVIDT